MGKAILQACHWFALGPGPWQVDQLAQYHSTVLLPLCSCLPLLLCVCVEVGEQFAGVASLLLPCEFWGLNVAHQA